MYRHKCRISDKNMQNNSSAGTSLKISRIDIIGQSGNDYPPTDLPSRMNSNNCHEGRLMNDLIQGSPENEQDQKNKSLQEL